MINVYVRIFAPRKDNDKRMFLYREAFKNIKAMEKFSVFCGPIRNKKPEAEVTLQQVYRYITSNESAKKATEMLRSIKDEKAQKKFKEQMFCWATFSGTFSYGDSRHLKVYSQLMALDFDDVGGPEAIERLKSKLIADEALEVLLLFTSPSGKGVKAVVPIGAKDASEHKMWFKGLYNYIKANYDGLEADRSGSDVCRACFLSYDKNAYINPKLLSKQDK